MERPMERLMAWKFGRVAGQNTVLLGETAMKKAIALIAVIVASTTWADSMTDYCESNAPTDTEYWNSPKDYADNFCALYMHERSKAFSQLNKSIVTNRARGNVGRIYFDPKQHPGDKYIQVRRPWMADREVEIFGYARTGSSLEGGRSLTDSNQYRKICVTGLTGVSCSTLETVAWGAHEDVGNNGTRASFSQITVVFSWPYKDMRFPNADEAKKCAEAILDRMEDAPVGVGDERRAHYDHHSVTSACPAW